ncbi:MAG TPA: hypothetical protein RMH99_09095 [Sandaracinaceae bacterium LLY-WYZ-13_1]|nr:hypothetical protein [Sandaracinaceae bacterium LLY-WYZ-13_1]
MDQNEQPDWLVRARRRNRRLMILVFGGTAALFLGGGAAYWLWPTASKDLAAAHDRIESRRAQYCAIWERLREAEPEGDDLRGDGERVVLPGYVFLDAADLSAPLPGANADQIETTELAALCDDGERGSTRLFGSVLGKLAVDPDGRLADGYDRDGVALALSLLDDFEYLLVLDVGAHADSRVGSDGGLDPGALVGRVSLFRLEDARSFGSLAVNLQAPSSAYVYVSQGAYGQTDSRELDSAVNAEASHFFRSAIARRVSGRGLTLVVEDES